MGILSPNKKLYEINKASRLCSHQKLKNLNHFYISLLLHKKKPSKHQELEEEHEVKVTAFKKKKFTELITDRKGNEKKMESREIHFHIH